MKIKLVPSKFRISDEVYLLYQGGACLVKITDVYKYENSWYYSIDASNYKSGLELEWVRETALSKYPSCRKNNIPYSKEIIDNLLSEFESLY